MDGDAAVEPMDEVRSASATARNRSVGVADDLRRRLQDGEWAPGERLPGEHHLAAEYEVSRATVRTALRTLESQGLTTTRHGSGTFATGSTSGIHADLRHLDSMTATIRRVGAEPGMSYRLREVRAGTEVQAERLEIAVGDPVLVTERKLTADGQPVAFSYDVLPRAVLPDDLEVETIEGSLYDLLRDCGLEVAWAVTEVHAAVGDDIGWGRRPADTVYVVLDQVHRTIEDRPVAWSRTYYLEGRFRFSLVRTR